MSKYTTSIEVIINSQSNHSDDVFERIETGRKFLFDFDYLVPNADFRKSFETQFIEKYWQECIGYATVPLFKLKLKQRLEMLMPEICFKYNALQEIINLKNPALERHGNSVETGTNIANSTVDGTGTSKSKDIVSNLPASIINSNTIGAVTHASNGGMNEGTNTSKTVGTSDAEHTIERMFEEYGNQLKGYVDWYESYHNLMNELLLAFDDMFIQLLF